MNSSDNKGLLDNKTMGSPSLFDMDSNAGLNRRGVPPEISEARQQKDIFKLVHDDAQDLDEDYINKLAGQF